jgi:hypothetical protein
LENLAMALGSLPETPWRNPGRAMKGADEVRDVFKSGVVRDLRHGLRTVGQ